MLNGHAYSRAVRAHIWTNLILAGIILDEVDLTGKERAETENKLRESERSLILFVKENRTYQSLRAKFKTALHNHRITGSSLGIKVIANDILCSKVTFRLTVQSSSKKYKEDDETWI
jgi:hypothetical protein